MPPISFPRICLFAAVLAGLLAPGVRAETLAEKTLKDVVQRQRDIFAKAEAEGDDLDEARLKGEVQSLVSSYDVLIQKNPEFAPAYVAYGLLLGRIGMTKEAVAILLKANKLDPDLAVVKNQIAKHLAEDGKPLEALPWIMAAIDLEPKEPLYHYQLGTLLHVAREDFLRSGDFTRAALDRAMLQAFQRAADDAPGNMAYAYRHAEAYYDLQEPKWDEAFAAWQQLEHRASAGLERQTIQLHEAKVRFEQKRPGEARALLDGVTDLRLTAQKQKLLDEFAKGAAAK
ncbi:MAG: hypothetical protein HY302_05725 [Opitutae bacterium]|nr:hypothetical protein [Opitutae bacterium]